ncbi:hypothetical protein BJX62DRAFT_233985 [Aspergillus germanicus]
MLRKNLISLLAPIAASDAVYLKSTSKFHGKISESRLGNVKRRGLFRTLITGTLCQFPYRKPFVGIPIDRGVTQGNDFIYPPISAKLRRLALIMLNDIIRNCLVVVPSIHKRLRFAWISY